MISRLLERHRSTAILGLLGASLLLPKCRSGNSFTDLFEEQGGAAGAESAAVWDAGDGGEEPASDVLAGAGGAPREAPDAGASGDEPGAGRASSSGGTVGRAGAGTGGSAQAGAPAPSAGSSGSGGAAPMPAPGPDFILGADISSVPEALDEGAVFLDTDGQEKPFLELLAGHGFNYVRLRTFVEPGNLYGYANPNGEWSRAEPYCDLDHTVEFARAVKDAGLKLLVDLHYSDNWADPGKQIIPESWRDVSSIEELGERVRAYTREVVEALTAAGARPDMIQLGNEITPGMLVHVPEATQGNVDNSGNVATRVNAVNGASSNWTNLGLLLRKGVEGVREADPNEDIAIMLHIIGANDVSGALWWVGNAVEQGVEFDVLGLSCYTNWHGAPSTWESTFQTLARNFPNLSFVVAEYNPEARRVNEIMRDLPGRRGLGSFFWEPTESGSWGPALFSATPTARTYAADTRAFAEYDAIRSDFGLDERPFPDEGGGGVR